MVIAAVVLGALNIQAPAWRPLRVDYEIRRDEEGIPVDVPRFWWILGDQRWAVMLPATAGDNAPPPVIDGPGGRKPAELDGFVLDTANGLITLPEPHWDQCWETGLRDPTPHHLLEVWENASWRVFRLIWPIGGASGPPPVPLVTIAQDRKTGRWAALATSLDLHVPDGGDTHGLEEEPDGALRAWCWQWHTQSVLVRWSWVVTATPSGVHWRRAPSSYMLNTYNGVPATYASDPRDAVHWGYQEVAWHVSSLTARGGEARAFSNSPRRIESADDVFDGLLVPAAGATAHFAWPAQAYVVPYRRRGHWATPSEALDLSRAGGWDVVLFRHRDGQYLADRLIEHQRDFPHSTPPAAPAVE